MLKSLILLSIIVEKEIVTDYCGGWVCTSRLVLVVQLQHRHMCANAKNDVHNPFGISPPQPLVSLLRRREPTILRHVSPLWVPPLVPKPNPNETSTDRCLPFPMSCGGFVLLVLGSHSDIHTNSSDCVLLLPMIRCG